MTTPTTTNTRQSTPDDRPLWDLIGGLLTYKAVAVAHHLKLFTLLAETPRTTADICDALHLERRPATALLAACTAAGLLRATDGHYELTPLSQTYLLPDSPHYFGGFLDMLIANDAVFSFESLQQAVLTNKSQVYGGDDPFLPQEEMMARVRGFTYGMHSHSAGAASVWPDVVDLSDARVLLDVGGGSGVHAINAAERWPQLQAIVYDLPPVCAVATEFITQAGLQGRIQTQPGNMWIDPFPNADVHFYADILHDWTPEKGRVLLQKSFASLPSGGSILLHEMLYNEDKTGPQMATAYSVAMLLWTEGQQYSGNELAALLAEAGFTDIAIKPSLGYMSIVIARKP